MIRSLATSMTCAFVLGATALAQQPATQPRTFAMRPWPRFQLLNEPAVQEELELTRKQKEQLDQLVRDLRKQADEHKKAVEQLVAQEPDPDVQGELRQQQRSRRLLFMVQNEPQMLKVLSPKQLARLNEIRMQAAGVGAFLLPDVQQRLNLSPGQIEAIKQILQQGIDAQGQLADRTERARNQVLARAERREGDAQKKLELKPAEQEALNSAEAKRVQDYAAFRRSTDQQVSKLLTRRQRETYQKMLGEPFIVDGVLVPRASESPAKDAPKSP